MSEKQGQSHETVTLPSADGAGPSDTSGPGGAGPSQSAGPGDGGASGTSGTGGAPAVAPGPPPGPWPTDGHSMRRPAPGLVDTVPAAGRLARDTDGAARTDPVATGAPITVGTVGRAWRALVGAVGDLLDGRPRIWALEAGAGTRPLFDLPEDAYIVGVDRDGEALERNRRLDERVVADLENYRPWAAGFDLITSWYVLDSMPAPAPVLDRMAGWTAHGGLIVLGVPNLRSPLGLLARLTRRSRLRRTLTPGSLRRRFEEHGFVPVLQVFFEDAEQAARRRRLKITRGRWKAVQLLVRIVSLGLLDAARTDYIVVFRRED